MAVQSKLAPPSARTRTKATSTATPAAAKARAPNADHDNKENHYPAAPRQQLASKEIYDYDGQDESEQSDPDMDYFPGHNNEDQVDDYNDFAEGDTTNQHAYDNSDAEDNDEEEHSRGRNRRLSEKEAQRRAEKAEAEARKAAKADKAAQKQRQRTMEPEPLEDTVFTSRDVQLPAKAAKKLQQRDSRVPVTQARPTFIERTPNTQRGRTHEPVQDLHQIIARQEGNVRAGPSNQGGRGLASQSISDWRNSAVVQPMEIDSEPPHPRSINGHVFPARVHVDLHYVRDGGHSRRRPNNDHSRSRSRSRSPTTGDKRARSPDDNDVRVAQVQKTNDHQGRSRQKDYDDITQEMIASAVTWFRCLAATEEPFPEHLKEANLVKLAWSKAEEELKISMPLTPDIAKLISRRGPQMRGELKTKVRALTELVFGFESGQNKRNVRKKRQLVEDLKEGLGYCYKEFSPDVAQRKGLYKAKIIQKAVNQMWFNNRRDEGATHPELFGPAFPKPAFALVLTAIECCIDEWATCVKTDIPFTSADYRSIHQEHLKCLDEFENHSAPHDILGNILTRTHNIGRFHSGAQPLAPKASPSVLSKAALDAAVREYEEDDKTESDGENGDQLQD
ncbi:hypothetical protein MVEN_00487400 [Mycena venus]|uniref:DUF6532 domain-containing protein n=1 Tax=Mycena venus TaxID=2733690 RepID=A0A8H6YWI7_9AGAR|nr:hypothetical protein MVEN_00487400 [Mycena venus]